MGNFSTIRTAFKCSVCGVQSEVDVQFKYGNLYAHEYALGGEIVWGRTQVGDPAESRVAVLGFSSCPHCHEEACFDLIVDNGHIESVEPISGSYDYHHGEGFYVIIKR